MSSVLILGDSIVKNFDTQKFNTIYEKEDKTGQVYVFSYPGINAQKLAVQVSIEKMPSPDDIGLVILHVGTNGMGYIIRMFSIEPFFFWKLTSVDHAFEISYFVMYSAVS